MKKLSVQQSKRASGGSIRSFHGVGVQD